MFRLAPEPPDFQLTPLSHVAVVVRLAHRVPVVGTALAVAAAGRQGRVDPFPGRIARELPDAGLRPAVVVQDLRFGRLDAADGRSRDGDVVGVALAPRGLEELVDAGVADALELLGGRRERAVERRGRGGVFRAAGGALRRCFCHLRRDRRGIRPAVRVRRRGRLGRLHRGVLVEEERGDERPGVRVGVEVRRALGGEGDDRLRAVVGRDEDPSLRAVGEQVGQDDLLPAVFALEHGRFFVDVGAELALEDLAARVGAVALRDGEGVLGRYGRGLRAGRGEEEERHERGDKTERTDVLHVSVRLWVKPDPPVLPELPALYPKPAPRATPRPCQRSRPRVNRAGFRAATSAGREAAAGRPLAPRAERNTSLYGRSDSVAAALIWKNRAPLVPASTSKESRSPLRVCFEVTRVNVPSTVPLA